jgi:hypothetical protein
MSVSPFVDRDVTIAMERAGFSIKRAADKSIVWRRDLVGSYHQIHFARFELYGEPHLKGWVLVYGNDPDVTVLMALKLDMFAALRIARSLEAATAGCPLRGAPMTDQRDSIGRMIGTPGSRYPASGRSQ